MYTLEQFLSRYGNTFESYFEHLVGATVENISDPYIDRGYVTGDVEMDEGTKLPTHFRIANPTEVAMEQEIPADDDLSFDDLYYGSIIDQSVQRIEAKADYERHEAYLYFYVTKNMYFEVPIGFNGKTGELYGFAKELLNDEWNKYAIQ